MTTTRILFLLTMLTLLIAAFLVWLYAVIRKAIELNLWRRRLLRRLRDRRRE